MNDIDKLMADFFGSTAKVYEDCIVPAFRPFAQRVCDEANIQNNEDVLDVGTGTGILARLVAPQSKITYGLDLVPELIEMAEDISENNQHQNLEFVVGNAHNMPFNNVQFDVCVSSFGLNATNPDVVFSSIASVLKQEGRLVFQEWGSERHILDQEMAAIIQKYAVSQSDASGELVAMREASVIMTREWNKVMNTTKVFHDMLTKSGFTDVSVAEGTFVDCNLSWEAFKTYKLAWTERASEIDEMPESARGACISEIDAMLQRHANAEGIINYNPLLFLVSAKKSLT